MENQEEKANTRQGKIYRIYYINDPDQFYIGGTFNELRVRFQQHKDRAKGGHHNNIKLYSIMDTYGFECFRIILVEELECSTRTELLRKEGEYIMSLKPSLNTCIAGRTSKEWREDNKEYVQQENIKKYEKNKDHIKQKSKQWSEQNKEQKALTSKLYREKNKERIKEQKNKRILCVCGKQYNNSGKGVHEKSKFHLQAVKELNDLASDVIPITSPIAGE